ncbi:ABC transporter ATP-binding protein [Naasia lichenicola]|uniref:ABC transporter ATP-binding protein n=1 Tax=Naasia lichenicola TaxID=2565933 RepID=A0A4S4FHL2_9MICO|nr:ABC transporter ATP-binding protein [Naasia lichenicola]THG29780.1 ABC transporter ATP-binding protein [Naasia lichenicola]
MPADRRPNTVSALWRLLPYARPALPRLILGMVVGIAAGLVALAIPQVLEYLVDTVLADRNAAGILPAALLILGLGVFEAAAILVRRTLVLTPNTHIEARMRNALFEHLQRLPVAFHDRWPSGQLLSRAISDLSAIRRWLAFGLMLLVVNTVTIVVGAILLITTSPLLGVVYLVMSVPIWFVGAKFERTYTLVARRSQDQTGDLATAVEESVHGIRVLKAFGRGGHALKKFERQAEELRGTELEKASAVAFVWRWLILIPDVTFAVCLALGVVLAAQGSLTAGALVAFFATATVLRFPVESIGFLLSFTLDTRTATDRYFEVMDEPNTITDPQSPRTLDQPQGLLEFRDVHFRYPDAPDRFADLVNGVDLRIEPGETMALVGLTGSGKSTITALVTRLYDIDSGAITLDGVDIRDLRLDELRSRVAMAFEDATLFSATVRENVLLGRPDAGEEALAEALRIAQAQFVHDLPDGLDTVIGEEGLSLSGGQRQRLALARAVAARPSVLVLDDPLSALDVETEELVESALRHVLASTTALIVAHRPSTVMLADRVAVLEDGRITAVGRHSELLATNDHYRFVISSLDEERKTAAASGSDSDAAADDAAVIDAEEVRA